MPQSVFSLSPVFAYRVLYKGVLDKERPCEKFFRLPEKSIINFTPQVPLTERKIIMAYRYDQDLEFLANCSSAELKDFAELLIYDKDGNERLTGDMDLAKRYKYQPDCSQYWRELAAELQKFGGNSFANILRGGEGVLYKEILGDVCSKMKVKGFSEDKSIEWNEELFIVQIMPSIIEQLPPDMLQAIAQEVGEENVNSLTPQAATALFIKIFRMGGFKSYQITLIIVNAIWKFLFGRGLTVATNATIARVLGILTGPIGWTLTGIWTALDIASPAFRITVPAVFQIILLRKLSTHRALIEEQKSNQ